MSEETTDKRGIIILVSGVLFIALIVAVLLGVGKYTSFFTDKAVDLIKESAGTSDQQNNPQINSADAPYLEHNIGSSENTSNLQVGDSPVNYGFTMDVEKAAQQQDTVEKYSVPSIPPGQPGSKEWQDQFWQDR